VQVLSSLLRILGILVPGHARAAWLAEWGAEMHAGHARGIGRITLARRLGAAALHAAWLRKETVSAGFSSTGFALDLRLATRLVARQPALTIAVVLTLALGIGANTALYTVLRASIFRPLPVRNADRLVVAWQVNAAGAERSPFSYPDYADWISSAQTIDQAAAFSRGNGIATGVPEADRVNLASITPGYFSLVGGAVRGRAFTADDSVPGSERVVIVSGAFVRKQLAGGEPLGRTFQIDGVPRRIVGVVESDPLAAVFEPAADVWVPLLLRPQVVEGRGNRNFSVIARLKDRATAADASAEFDALMTRLAALHPQTNAKRAGYVIPLTEQLSGRVSRSLWLAGIVTGIVLLVACANVASLLLVRNLERAREFTLRAALGAGRGRLARQILIESSLFSVLGAAAGLGVLCFLTPILVSYLPATVPRRDEIAVDPVVAGAALLLSLVTALAAGLPAAWITSRASAAKSEDRHTGSGLVLRRALVTMQLAAAVLLLVCGGLLVRSFVRIQSVDPGFSPERVATMQISIPRAHADPAASVAFAERMIASVESRPGVERAALFGPVPFSGHVNGWSVTADGITLPSVVKTDRYTTTAGAPSLMGVTLVRGRFLEGADFTLAGAGNAVIDDVFAARVFGEADPIGRQVKLESNRPLTIVGITRHVKHYGFDEKARPQIYVPLAYDPSSWLNLVVRAKGDDAAAIIADVRRAVLETDPNAPPFEAVTVRTLMDRTVGDRRVASSLAAALAGVTLVIAIAGLYGAMSFSVQRRTREIGVRVALGATRASVSRLILGESARVAALGVAAGLVAAVFCARLLRSFLFNTTVYDPATYAVVALLLAGVTIMAAAGPARRAASVDPLTALRTD
jgi:putative ABC transport system permease protein